MAHLHCIDHGKRVVVVPFEYVTKKTERRNAGSFLVSVALHRNGGRTTERCYSGLQIGRNPAIRVTIEDVGGGILKILNSHRHGKSHQTSSR